MIKQAKSALAIDAARFALFLNVFLSGPEPALVPVPVAAKRPRHLKR